MNIGEHKRTLYRLQKEALDLQHKSDSRDRTTEGDLYGEYAEKIGGAIQELAILETEVA